MTLISNRPVWDYTMTKELSLIVGRLVWEWASSDYKLHECEDYAEKVLGECINGNGYELAKRFESYGFLPDADLVEAIGNTEGHKYEILNDRIVSWVKDNNLKLIFKVGDIVEVKTNNLSGIFEITDVRPRTMCYAVWNESCGRKEIFGAYIVPFESIIAPSTEEKANVCPKCGNYGIIQDEEGRNSTCHCHY